LRGPCVLASDASVLHDLAAGDLVRSIDLGAQPDVVSGSPVRITATSGTVSITAIGTALADAHRGDRVDVRLLRPTRVLHGRVSGPGLVELADAWQ
jgi:flagella basal body P-ring formation protein FlgA